MQSVYPVLRYPDVRAAVDFLCSAFGLTVREVHELPDGTVVHVELEFAGDLVMLGPGPAPRSRPTDDDYVIYLAIDDVDAHHERARAAGADIVRGPFDTDYGSRDYAARDLIGLVWSFGTYRP
ncbi:MULTISPECIES: VOC family protein [unclassified Micromonospora]|uniref:VOC family protein n=1 Tax=unclassified Micromonospora TaxID=2617518 RepID=UPI001C225398|nr:MULTISPECIES: VOC family protein [unclassified Micromonospora]MBU8856069.1 VOC family protein [Micromonospora sp. WMMB482]MDM4781675.1 VOC family protein [Micromonospora sp. b486]